MNKKYIHYFDTEQEYNDKRTNDYYEPWIGYTESNDSVSYNKSEYEKLLSMPLTFKITSNGDIKWQTKNASSAREIQYSKNDSEWILITSTTDGASISVVVGDVIKFKSNVFPTSSTSNFNTFSGTTAGFELEGNIMSLGGGDNFSSLTGITQNYAFYSLFQNCTGLTDASKLLLPATTLTTSCYEGMFKNCTGLTTAPTLSATILASSCYKFMFTDCTNLTIAPQLPVTTLATSCYEYMFYGCAYLTTAPALPATTLVSNCYANMFRGCSRLISSPVLPATTLASGCYLSMFYDCTSLTTAPSLPATTLANLCYHSMFYGCTGLTTAPTLPATTLMGLCYYYMFYGCSNLNYIKCLATNISAGSCTEDWVRDVASTGIFVKPASTDWASKTGTSGIPSGWTIQNA